MKFKKKIRKGLCKVTSAFLSVLILFSMTAYGSAPPENKNVLLNEASVSYENYTLEDLPKAVKESVISSEKTPMEIVESAPEDLYSVTVKNEDGSNTLSIFGQPIKYIDEDGTIRVKRNELNKSDKLSSLFEKYAFECTDNVIKGYFPKKTDKEIKMVYNDFDITFAPIINKENNSIFDAVLDFLKSGKEKTEASGLIPSDSVINGETETGDNITSLDTTVKEEKETEETKTPYPDIPETSEETVEPAQTSLPETSQKEEFVSKEAVLSGGKEGMVVYENVFSEHISLEYMPVLGGIKENIVLEQYEGINEFEFIINTGGLIPAENSGISIDLLNPNTNEIELCIGQVDSKDSFTGENVNNDVHFTLENSMELRPTGKNSEYIIKIIVDKSFLESEATVYPVTVDPTVTIGVDPIYDAPVFSGYPNTNYRTNAYNTVGYYNSSYKEAITYFKVDCMTSYNYIDPAKVTSAYLHTYETSGHTSSVTIQVHDTMSTWVNSSITYANRPDTYNYNASNNVNLTNTNTWYNFTITGLVIDWLNYERDEGGWTQNFGFALVPSTSGASYRQFCSANHSSNLPSIVINYSDLRTIPDGMYFIRSKYSDLYLDTDPAQSANGNVIQYTFHGGKDQRWFVKYQSNGYYKFYTPQHNNTKCLDVVSNPTTNGARIDVYPDGSGDWLLFQIISCGNGSYRIKSKWSGNKKTLDVTGPSMSPNTNIQLYQYGNVNQQKWIFEASGSYINTTSDIPNCMGYALFCLEDMSDYYPIFNTDLTSELTEDYIDDIISSIKSSSHLVARSIDAYNSTIYLNEYRIAARVYFGDDNIIHYHFIYQLSNGRWAGKDGFNNSKYFSSGNPSNLAIMWENDKYPSSAGTEYFAVHFDLNEVLS
ncbi:MAG: DNRLRE domain-containing protein [Acutalibacteraceae bacterium]|jgi:hypothetical protein